MQINPVDLIADELLAGAEALPIEALPEVDARTANEIAAIKAFLSKWSRSPHTLRRYRVEIARLWLWATEKGLMISELTYEDLNAYRDFLQDPQPYERWCSGKKYRRDSPKLEALRFCPVAQLRPSCVQRNWRPVQRLASLRAHHL